jgi:hypothetical protein
MKQLDIGKVLSESFDMYASNWQPLITMAAIVWVPTALLSAIMAELLASSNWIGGALVAVVTIAFAIIAGTILSGMYVLAVDDMRDGSFEGTIGVLFEQAKSKLGALIVVGILGGLGVMAGLILFIIPGIVLAVWWSVAAATVMLEGKTGTEALGRSKELVSGQWWQMFGLIIVANILGAIIGGILGAVLGAVFGDGFIGHFINNFASNVLIGPFVAIVPVLAYFELIGGGGSGDQYSPPSPGGEIPPAPPTGGSDTPRAPHEM